MREALAILLGMAIIVANGCVGAKVYRAEKKNRIAAETREKVLVEELLFRKKETATLTQSVGDLSRNLGRQDVEIKNLQTELTARTVSMGESASKLASEKANLERKFASTQDLLDNRNASLQRIKAVQDKRKSILSDLEAGLSKAFQANKAVGLRVAVQGELVILSFPDNVLFEPGGLLISNTGQDLLVVLAQYLAARPGLDVDIVAYTDNVLPAKARTLKDTWDWSLQRATNIVRMLVQEFNVNANQLTPVGRGEFYPLTSNETQDGRLRNRRTVVVFRPQLPELPGVD